MVETIHGIFVPPMARRGVEERLQVRLAGTKSGQQSDLGGPWVPVRNKVRHRNPLPADAQMYRSHFTIVLDDAEADSAIVEYQNRPVAEEVGRVHRELPTSKHDAR